MRRACPQPAGDVAMRYTGRCNVCHTKWSTELQEPAPSIPNEFILECPIPWCGTVTMKKVDE